MNEFQNKSRENPHRSDYVWQYEYYDDEEPVSFEGLKAHRYSIVIGFWVGLAVFVIFMFFVLTLLTKTGAPPHQESTEPSGKRHRPGSCLADVPCPDDPEKAFSRPLLGEPRSFFHFYISEEEHPQRQRALRDQGDGAGDSPRTGAQGRVRNRGQLDSHGFGGISSSVIERMVDEGEEENDDAGLRPIGGGATRESVSEDTEDVLMSHFNIPNFVNSESPSSSLGDNDLLICESTLPPDSRSQTLEAHGTIA
ncbi:Melanocortin-2 receptor accessory protein 2A [Merluccius polli]|uniref:Melanocortin-2 receptor accessory protein 2A n=1 Tax=Merluccius polli TaxID=89951 RepID=A0AA47NP49_MERPO|nr:Melanocortin-2 receptor accessory protein 2A [Merluccius polli]